VTVVIFPFESLVCEKVGFWIFPLLRSWNHWVRVVLSLMS